MTSVSLCPKTSALDSTLANASWAKLNPELLADLEKVTGSGTPKQGGSGTAAGATGKSVDELMKYLASLGADADLTFIVFAMEIQKTNELVSEQIRSIQLTGKLRDAINDRISKLRDLHAYLKNHGKGGDDGKGAVMKKQQLLANRYGWEQGKSPAPPLPTPPDASKYVGGAKNGAYQQEAAKYEKDLASYNAYWSSEKGALDKANADLAIKDFLIDPQTGIISEKPSDKSLWDSKQISADHVESEIERLKGEVQKLDSQREIEMISLNANINKKSQTVQLLSNILKKQHESATSVIGNIR